MRSSQKRKKHPGTLTRRDFLRTGMLALGGCMVPQALRASLCPVLPFEKSLSFYNIHTGEQVKAVYWSEGLYVRESLNDINRILRDFRTGEVLTIDTGLLDLLHSLNDILGSRDIVHVISGYRSPETNEYLRKTTSGVAGHSMHLEGKAVDFRLPGFSLKNVHKAAVALQGGGVGYYPALDFVHMDTGRVRYW
jgi:uncharacterized protein YcbK (DUF882 family)